MKASKMFRTISFMVCLACGGFAFAQTEATVNARMDASKITVGDQVRLFIEAQYNARAGTLQWATIPDTFNLLEVVERGTIDSNRNGDMLVLKQRLLLTGFDSGMHTVPAFSFAMVPRSGNPYVLKTDSFQLLVQTVPVDTTKGFRDIKGIMQVQSTWMDYIWYILGALIFLGLVGFAIWYFRKNKKTAIPQQTGRPTETLQEKALRYLDELDREQLWQKNQVKEYYTRLTDILRQYIEERYRMPAMELTTDELLQAAKVNPELRGHLDLLGQILRTADMAKFARAQPAMQEHIAAMENARSFITDTTAVNNETTPAQ